MQQTVLEEYAGALLAKRTAESVISAVIQPLTSATAAVQLVQPLPGLPASAVQQGVVPAKVKIITAASVPGNNPATDVMTIAEKVRCLPAAHTLTACSPPSPRRCTGQCMQEPRKGRLPAGG